MKITKLSKMPPEEYTGENMPALIPVYPFGTLHGPGKDEKGRWIKPKPPPPIGWIGADGLMVKERDKAA